jgi:rod shape-determining protein MreD
VRWPIFAVFAFAALVLQLSARNALTLYSLWGISPDVVAALVVFVALFAPRTGALWAAWGLGLLVDLSPQDHAGGYYVVGPHALGYTAGAYLVLQLRTMVFRRRALTVGFLTSLALVAASLVAVMLLSIRSFYAGDGAMGYGPMSDLGQRCMIAMYSGLVAVPLGWLLGYTMPLWGFQPAAGRRW